MDCAGYDFIECLLLILVQGKTSPLYYYCLVRVFTAALLLWTGYTGSAIYSAKSEIPFRTASRSKIVSADPRSLLND